VGVRITPDPHTVSPSSFREDGALTLDWVASYLERVGELPVLSQVEPGAIRAALPSSPPDRPEPFSAVLDDLDRVLMPGLTHSQHPRWFSYFAITGSEPSILAELLIAGLNQLGILWRTSPALQDLEADNKEGLHSIPVRFGVGGALRISAASHMATVLLFAATGLVSSLAWPYWVGVTGVAGLLLFEHSLLSEDDLSRLHSAYFRVNGVVSTIFFLFTWLAVATGRR